MRDEDHERNKDTLARMVSAHGACHGTQELIEAGVLFHLFVRLPYCQVLYLIDLHHVLEARVNMLSQWASFLLHSYHQPFILPLKHVTEMTSSHKTCLDLLLFLDYINTAKPQSEHSSCCRLRRSSQHCYTIYAFSGHVLIWPPSSHSNKHAFSTSWLDWWQANAPSHLPTPK